VKPPRRLATVATATVATGLVAAVSFALAAPPASGPGDDALPVIITTVTLDAPAAAAGAPATTATDAPAVPAPGAVRQPTIVPDGDPVGDHETVAPRVRVEDGSDDDSEIDESDDSSDTGRDGESSLSNEADSTRD